METAEKRQASRRRQALRKILFFIGLACVILSNAALQQTILQALGIAINFGLMMVASIAQFWGLMYWLGSTKVEKIVPGDAVQLTMADYVGQPVVSRNVQALIECLKGHGNIEGSELPKGILLAGPPGSGKSYLAKCMASEAQVAVLLLDASGIVNMFMGMSQVRIRTLFSKAKRLAEKYGSCILVFDEIDAIASARGGMMGEGMSMYGGMMGGARGLNTLLSCIDGLGTPPGMTEWFKRKWYGWRKKPLPPAKGYVLFIGSTNRPDVLDPALMRPGRVDMPIWIHAPYEEGLRQIIDYYLLKVKHADCDTALMARTMRGQTPAAVRTILLRQAALQATLADRDHITEQDIYQGMVEAILGLEDPPPAPHLRDRQLIAIHEAGHAVASMALFPEEMSIWLATIVPHSGAHGIGRTLGLVWPRLSDERQSLPLDHYVFRMQVSMAGRTAVEITGRTEMGATGDMRSLAALVGALIREGGFGDLAAIMAIQQTGVPQAYPKDLQDTVGEFLARQRKATRLLLESNWDIVKAFTTLLLDKGTVTSNDVQTFFTKHPPIVPGEVKRLAQLDKERYEKLAS